MMDTRFSSAIHMLILISEAEVPMTSAEIAKSVGTNPSYIRRITGLLKKNKIIELQAVDPGAGADFIHSLQCGFGN